MEKENENSDDSNNGCAGVIVWFAVFFGGIFIITQLEKANPGLGMNVLLFVILAFPAYFLVMYLIENGAKGIPGQSKKLIMTIAIGLFVLFIIGSLGKCSGSSSGGNCAYKVGCW